MADSKLVFSIDDLSQKLISAESIIAVGETFDCFFAGAKDWDGRRVFLAFYDFGGNPVWSAKLGVVPEMLDAVSGYFAAGCLVNTEEAARVVHYGASEVIAALVTENAAGDRTVYGAARVRLHPGYADDGTPLHPFETDLRQHNADEQAHPAIRSAIELLKQELVVTIAAAVTTCANNEEYLRNQVIHTEITRVYDKLKVDIVEMGEGFVDKKIALHDGDALAHKGLLEAIKDEVASRTASDATLQDAIASEAVRATASESDLKAKFASVYRPCGSVSTVADLPQYAANGDVYNVLADGMNYAWVAAETRWDALGAIIDLGAYATCSWVNNSLAPYATCQQIICCLKSYARLDTDNRFSGSLEIFKSYNNYTNNVVLDDCSLNFRGQDRLCPGRITFYACGYQEEIYVGKIGEDLTCGACGGYPECSNTILRMRDLYWGCGGFTMEASGNLVYPPLSNCCNFSEIFCFTDYCTFISNSSNKSGTGVKIGSYVNEGSGYGEDVVLIGNCSYSRGDRAVGIGNSVWVGSQSISIGQGACSSDFSTIIGSGNYVTGQYGDTGFNYRIEGIGALLLANGCTEGGQCGFRRAFAMGRFNNYGGIYDTEDQIMFAAENQKLTIPFAAFAAFAVREIPGAMLQDMIREDRI